MTSVFLGTMGLFRLVILCLYGLFLAGSYAAEDAAPHKTLLEKDGGDDKAFKSDQRRGRTVLRAPVKIHCHEDPTAMTRTAAAAATTTMMRTASTTAEILWLNMTLCTGRCTGDCKSYITPLGMCFSPAELFPNDASWAGSDILDQLVLLPSTTTASLSMSKIDSFRRTIFSSVNGTCTGTEPNDIFEIPLLECVGPFDQPRPWGSFAVVMMMVQLVGASQTSGAA
jgi:hypothetical protein